MCFLHGPTSLISTCMSSFALRLAPASGSSPTDDGGAGFAVPAPRCSSKASSRRDTRLGWLWVRHHATDALERKPPTRDGIDPEREKGFEPSTPTLATWCSTPELLPHHPTGPRCSVRRARGSLRPAAAHNGRFQYSAVDPGLQAIFEQNAGPRCRPPPTAAPRRSVGRPGRVMAGPRGLAILLPICVAGPRSDNLDD